MTLFPYTTLFRSWIHWYRLFCLIIPRLHLHNYNIKWCRIADIDSLILSVLWVSTHHIISLLYIWMNSEELELFYQFTFLLFCNFHYSTLFFGSPNDHVRFSKITCTFAIHLLTKLCSSMWSKLMYSLLFIFFLI